MQLNFDYSKTFYHKNCKNAIAFIAFDMFFEKKIKKLSQKWMLIKN